MMADLRRFYVSESGQPASEAELRELLADMNRRGLTPEQIRDAVEAGRSEPGGRISVGAVRGAIGRGPVAVAGEGETAPEPEPTRPAAPEGPGEDIARGGTEPAAGTGGTREGEGEEEAAAGGGIPVSSASDRRYDGTGGGALEGATAQVREGRSGHTVGTEPVIDIVARWQGRPVEIVRDVPTRVVRRTFAPPGSTADNATRLIIHYELLVGVRFTRVPGAGVLARGSVVRYGLPWGGGAAREAPR